MNIENKTDHSTEETDLSAPYIRELTEKLKLDKSTTELELLSSSVINEKLEVNVYKDKKTKTVIIGLDHYKVLDQEVLITLESFKKIESILQKQGL